MMLQLYGWDLIEKVVDNATITASSKLCIGTWLLERVWFGITGESNVFNMMRKAILSGLSIRKMEPALDMIPSP